MTIKNYTTNFALVNKETKIVENIIWGNVYNTQQDFEDDNIQVIQIDDLGVQIGDIYNNKSFYHEGEKVISFQDILKNEVLYYIYYPLAKLSHFDNVIEIPENIIYSTLEFIISHRGYSDKDEFIGLIEKITDNGKITVSQKQQLLQELQEI